MVTQEQLQDYLSIWDANSQTPSETYWIKNFEGGAQMFVLEQALQGGTRQARVWDHCYNGLNNVMYLNNSGIKPGSHITE